MKNIFVCLICMLSLFSCKSFSQKEIKYYSDGTISEICTKKNGELDGKFEAYYPNGGKYSVGIFKNGKTEGKWECWYTNGTLMSVQEFKNGKLTKINAWDKNSNQTLKDGTGVAILYYSNGDTLSKSEYKDCQLNGKTETWYENGKKESELYYLHGKLNGNIYFWNEDGTIKNKE